MKKRFLALGFAILISSLAVMGVGAYLKYGLLHAFAMVQDMSIVEVPFALMSDPGLRYALVNTVEPAEQTTAPATQPLDPTTVPETTAAPTTVPTTVPPTTMPTVPETTVPATTVAETAPEMQPLAEPSAPAEPDFSQGGVETSWYDDVLFIGDSRTCGLQMFAPAGNAQYFCSVGMDVFNYMECENTYGGFENMLFADVMAQRQYGKIFINLGLNESGYPLEALVKAYGELLEQIKAAQPDAKIILQGIMMVSKIKAEEAASFAPENLRLINEQIAAFADGERVFYMDANDVLAQDEGYLSPHLSSDGCHLYPEYAQIWADWISYTSAQMGI